MFAGSQCTCRYERDPSDKCRTDLSTGEQKVLSSHTTGAKCVAYAPNLNIVISAAWDSTLHLHLLDDPSRMPATIPLPSKPFSISLTPTKLVVAMASRHVFIYDLKGMKLLASQSQPESSSDENTLQVEPFQRRESSMKFMTRCVACMPSDVGYATSSIEGRIAVDWFDESEEAQKKKYAFKCHRQTENDSDVVYPVNALAFHPVHKTTFASGGGDGTVNLWDGMAKRRIRQYQKYPASVAALGFSADGKYLAVGVSPGFEDGNDHPEGIVTVFIRELSENEAKGRSAK